MVAIHPSIPTKFSALQYSGVEFDTKPCSAWTIEPVHGGGRVKRLGGRPSRVRGVWWFAHKTNGGRFHGLGLKTKSEGPTRRRQDPGVSGSFDAEDTRWDRMACIGRMRGAVKDGKTHKHYINAPAWVLSPVIELGVVESFPTQAGTDILAMSVCGWGSLSATLGFISPLLFLIFPRHFLLHFLSRLA
jgi:hypothetical protein